MIKNTLIKNTILVFLLGIFILLFFRGVIIEKRQKQFIFQSNLVDTKIPKFEFEDIYSGKIFTDETILLKDNKLKMINFFASWCLPCKKEHSLLRKITYKYNIPIYGFAYRDTITNVKKYLAEKQNPYINISMISEREFRGLFQMYGIPETLIVNQDNDIIGHFRGPITDENFKYFLDQYKQNSR